MKEILMFNKINKIEPYIFFVILLINVAPVFGVKYFVTLDGGAHCNNVNIIRTLLIEPSSIYSNIYMINPEFVPNWSGHFVLVVLGFFFKYYISEKILIAIVLILLPVFFREIVKKIAPQNIFISFLFFPFTHYILLYLGFYNFTLGVLFFFILISFWLKNHEKMNGYLYAVLTCLFFAIYFSHLFVFIVSVLFVGIHILFSDGACAEKEAIKRLLKKGTPALLCALPFLFLTTNYFISRPAKAPAEVLYLPKEKIVKMIKEGEVFTTSYNEMPYAKIIVFILLFLFLLAITNKLIRLWNADKKGDELKLFLKKPAFVFLVLTILLFSLAFVLPNDDGYGGYITIRFVYLGLIFLLLFSSDQTILGTGFNILLISVSSFLYFNIMESKKEGISWRSQERKVLEPAFDIITPNATVFHVNLANKTDWLMGHMVENIGAEKSALILNNYEASKGYFPITWNCSQRTNYVAGEYNFVMNDCGNSLINETREADFVLIYGDKTDNVEYLEIVERIKNKYTIVYESIKINLFKKS